MENPKVGDVVRLNSGGPDMTITEVGADTAVAVWECGETEAGDSFPTACLTRVEK